MAPNYSSDYLFDGVNSTRTYKERNDLKAVNGKDGVDTKQKTKSINGSLCSSFVVNIYSHDGKVVDAEIYQPSEKGHMLPSAAELDAIITLFSKIRGYRPFYPEHQSAAMQQIMNDQMAAMQLLHIRQMEDMQKTQKPYYSLGGEIYKTPSDFYGNGY